MQKLLNTLNQTLLDSICLLADNHNFQELLSILLCQGVNRDAIGIALFEIARHLMASYRLVPARSILKFLADNLDSEAERARLNKIIDDIDRLDKNNSVSEYEILNAGNMMDAVSSAMKGFLHTRNIEGLLQFRAYILGRVSSETHEAVHGLVDKVMALIFEQSDVQEQQKKLFQSNLKLLPRLTWMEAPQFQQILAEERTNKTRPDIFRIGDGVFARQGIEWVKLVAPEEAHAMKIRQAMGNMKPIAIHCVSIKDFQLVLNALTTRRPEAIRFDLYLILPLKILFDVMRVLEFTPLIECDFVVKLLFEEHLDEQFDYWFYKRHTLLPTLFVKLNPDDEFNQKILAPILNKHSVNISSRIEAYQNTVSNTYTKDHVVSVVGKIEKKEALRILFVTSRYTTFVQYATRDIAHGFRQLGHETCIILEDEGQGAGLRPDILLAHFHKFKPDIFFTINHLRYEYGSLVPKSIPFVTWVQDVCEHIIGIKEASLVGENDFIYSCFNEGKAGVNYMKAHPVLKEAHIGFLPIPINPDIYRPLECEFKFDVTYVGHCNLPGKFFKTFKRSSKRELDLEQLIFKEFVEHTYKYSILTLSKTIIHSDYRFFQRFIKKFLKRYGVDPGHISKDSAEYIFIQSFLPVILKSRILKALIDQNIDVAIFGRGWENHPWFSHCAMGPVNNGTELNRVYNETRINLNLTMLSTMHPKFCEVCGGGNFCLNLYTPEGVDDGLLSPILGRKRQLEFLVCFRDENELIDMVRYYLENEKERQRRADSLKEIVLANFTTSRAAETILNDIERKTGNS